MATKCIAFSNNDIILIAWSYAERLKDCVGFDVRRISAKEADTSSDAAQGASLPAMAGFPNDPKAGQPGQTTADSPIQKLFWKDLYVKGLKSKGPFIYQIIPLTVHTAANGTLTVSRLAGVKPLFSNSVNLTADHGPEDDATAIQAYFNRGILATQSLSRHLPKDNKDRPSSGSLLKHIGEPNDPIRKSLCGDLVQVLPSLLSEAKTEGGGCYAALYELNDKELEGYLVGNKQLHIVLSNTFDSASKDNDKENGPARERLHQSGVDVTDRYLPDATHIGHNKFVLYLDHKGTPTSVLTGSTNWTSTGLCAQTNNSLIVRSPSVAQAYSDYWDRLKQDTEDAQGDSHALQSQTFRKANDAAIAVDVPGATRKSKLWFSPNTTQKTKSKTVTPTDMSDVYERIQNAQHAVLFLAFDPGQPSLVDAAAQARVKNQRLFIRGALTNADRAGNFAIDLHDNHTEPDDPAQVIPATAVDDAFGVWEKELLNAGHAVIHDKIVVIDPFDPDRCTVITGSHNLGNKASFTNDENFLIIEGNCSLAQAYAVHVLDVYDHYRWRYLLSQYGTKDSWQGLKEDDSWQNRYFPPNGGAGDPELAFWLSAKSAQHHAK